MADVDATPAVKATAAAYGVDLGVVAGTGVGGRITVADVQAAGGQAAHPGATEKLMRYWAEGPGAAKIGWGTPGDFDRCRVNLGKYVQRPDELAGLCSNLHKRATGFRPGHAPSEGGNGR